MAGDGFPFFMYRQEQTHWCWAATSVSVSHFYDAASPWIQCILADDEFGSSNCCDNGGTPACNRPWYVYSGLKRVGHDGQVEDGVASALESEIAARRPVVTKISWNGGGAHFPLISGYADVVVSLNPFILERYLYIQDPWYGQSVILYNTFRTSYQNAGQWTVTFYTT
ncbi:papain-like cysteine protease family protein [Streptomyces sp. NPDC096033]|uniref:papain-like cysteine protease family protein n=1 Tax=Streptomyces sp. NPDC096033 TaxID=3366071 RepID=UPI00380B4321